MNNRRIPHRRGAALLFVLTLLMLVAVAISLALRTNLTARRESRRAMAALQSEYLANAGYDLAVARLQASAEHQGEIWQVPPEELGGRDAAQIKIEIAAGPEDAKVVTVVAEYPVGDSPHTQRHRLVRTWKPLAPPESAAP